MGTLGKELEADEVRVGSPCLFCAAFLSLDAEDQAAARRVIESGNGAALDRVLKERGFRIASQATSRHRRGDCITWQQING